MRRILIAVLLSMSSSAFAQVNYVRNGDFETHTGCPTNNNQIKLANNWSGIDSLNESDCDADYCHPCTNGTVDEKNNGVPLSYFYWQYPHSGNTMVQHCMIYDAIGSSAEGRNYLQGRLSKTLVAGKRYCVSFYVCLIEGSTYAIKEISAFLDNGSIDTASNCYMVQSRYTPQVTNTGSVITDTINWTKIEGSFVAAGNEKFITIGNFKEKANTTLQNIPQNPYNNNGLSITLYFIDDVAVVETGTKADAGPNTHVGRGDSVYIGRPSSEAIWCDWRVAGSSTIIGKGPGIWVKPTKTTNYECTQTLCGAVTKDTVNVQVWGLGVSSINGQSQIYSLTPNPNGGLFRISQSVSNEESVVAEVYNVVGQKMWSSIVSFKEGKASVDASKELTAGIYYFHLKDGSGNVSVLRFLKQ